ncbi:CLUMA_CG020954, isoform A [Clunio marinus]|uniref:CLUMA_CG020954, isoform A n=1 Tax=Clunio marinus TaxID=568069 RepID=A0A1J1J6C7_9DIPT|nr:CLUMA_CG020954, isoform A [Clunio marinus]
MKMEILTVQSHFGQNHIKVKGSNWTPATLTPPKSTKPHQEDDDELFQLPTFNDEAIQQVSDLLTKTLREAKHRHLLTCTEVLLPCELLQRVAVDMLTSSDEEACGIRGCNINIEFEDEMGQKRRISSIKTDPNTVSTFELILTLKQDRSGWTSTLPQFLKNLTRGGTIMISREFSLVKNKLGYCFD